MLLSQLPEEGRGGFSMSLIKTIDAKGSRIDDLSSGGMLHPLKRCKHLLRGSAHAEEPIIHPIKAPATILGMAGAVFVAMPATILRLAGFGCWLIANGLWVIQGKKVNDFYLMLLFSFYFVTAAFGVYNLT